jgi:ubiquinone/menaquinone biosynthesis C-methylase UbiE
MNKMQDEYDFKNPYGLETESDFHLSRKEATISLLQEFVVDNEKNGILDVGCGKGLITKILKNSFPNTKIDAIDISEKAINVATKEISGVNFIVADATEYSPKDKVYDAIILNNIYEHVENPVLLLMNLKPLLKKNGVFIISTPNRYHIKNIMRIILGYSIKVPNYHVTEYSIGQIYNHHAYCGLKVERIITPSFKYEKLKIINFVLIRLIQPIIDQYLRLRKSKNKLGSLLFVVSKI